MVDVPVCCMDLLSDIIEDQVSILVFSGVNVIDDGTGKLLDAPDVVCDCHGISFPNRFELIVRTGRAWGHSPLGHTLTPALTTWKKGCIDVGLDVTGLRKLDLTYVMP